jgi:hypothetical protein
MKIDKIKSNEENRIDLFMYRTMFGYSYTLLSILVYFNPRLDILNLSVGTKIWVPEDADIAQLSDIRGNYNLVK